MSILEKFKQLTTISTDNSCHNIFLENYEIPEDFNNKQKHQCVFEKLFVDFYKEGILNYHFFDIQKMSRIIHTHTVFLLGSLMYQKYKNYFSNQSVYKCDEKQFQLTWFLVSIVHDFMFDIEKKKDNQEYNSINGDLNSIIKLFDIKENLLTQNDVVRNQKLFTDFSTILPKYFKYRYEYDNKIDHGITAGLKLFDLLVKYRKHKYKPNSDYWKPELDNLYDEVALSIATHNIWAPDSLLKQKVYKDYGLEILCLDSNKNIFPIKFDNMPYLFLLGLVDTIEPTKIYSEFEPALVLQNLDIYISKKSIKITNLQSSPLDFSKLTSKVNGLENWLAVKLCVSQNQLEIKWN